MKGNRSSGETHKLRLIFLDHYETLLLQNESFYMQLPSKDFQNQDMLPNIHILTCV